MSLGTTLGWRLGDATFLEQVQRAGATAAAVRVQLGAAGALRRGYPANDLVEALAARRTVAGAVARVRPRALVVSTTTAAMLLPALPVPYAVRLDAPARMNRPGLRNAVLWPLERRGVGRARLVWPMSAQACEARPAGSAPAVVLPPPVVASGPPPAERQRVAAAYVPDPRAKGLDVVCAAWGRAAIEDARLEVFGIEPERGRAYLAEAGVQEPASVEWRGIVPAEEFRRALRGGHAYVGGARWEDFGRAPLEALADGALLVTASSGGPFAALEHALELEPGLVAPGIDPDGLAAALRRAFALEPAEAAAYRERAARLMERYHPERIQRTVEREVLPALLG